MLPTMKILQYFNFPKVGHFAIIYLIYTLFFCALQSPITTNQETTKLSHKCDFCDKTFSSNGGKKIHMSICSQKDSEKAKCDLCDKHFDSKPDLEQHCKVAHPDNCKCSICGKGFNQLKDLTKHLKAFHANRSEKQVIFKIINFAIQRLTFHLYFSVEIQM